MIVIIGAMQQEVLALLNLCHSYQKIDHSFLDLYKTTINNKTVIIAKSGIGKVEASITCSELIHLFNPTVIINIGSAGGLKPFQNIGDIVIGSTFNYHDLVIDPSNLTKYLDQYTFNSNTTLTNLMLTCTKQLNLTAHVGPIVSGDQFVCEENHVQTIIERFDQAIALDMESCAIAHTCFKQGVSLVVIRSLSDITLKKENNIDFDEFLPIAAKNSALVCHLFIKKYEEKESF